MAITLLLPTEYKTRLVRAEQIICRDKNHLHRSPIQNMVEMEINGHVVEITQDGDYFHTRIDESQIVTCCSPEELDQYIKDNA